MNGNNNGQLSQFFPAFRRLDDGETEDVLGLLDDHPKTLDNGMLTCPLTSEVFSGIDGNDNYPMVLPDKKVGHSVARSSYGNEDNNAQLTHPFNPSQTFRKSGLIPNRLLAEVCQKVQAVIGLIGKDNISEYEIFFTIRRALINPNTGKLFVEPVIDEHGHTHDHINCPPNCINNKSIQDLLGFVQDYRLSSRDEQQALASKYDALQKEYTEAKKKYADTEEKCTKLEKSKKKYKNNCTELSKDHAQGKAMLEALQKKHKALGETFNTRKIALVALQEERTKLAKSKEEYKRQYEAGAAVYEALQPRHEKLQKNYDFARKEFQRVSGVDRAEKNTLKKEIKELQRVSGVDRAEKNTLKKQIKALQQQNTNRNQKLTDFTALQEKHKKLQKEHETLESQYIRMSTSLFDMQEKSLTFCHGVAKARAARLKQEKKNSQSSAEKIRTF